MLNRVLSVCIVGLGLLAVGNLVAQDTYCKGMCSPSYVEITTTSCASAVYDEETMTWSCPGNCTGTATLIEGGGCLINEEPTAQQCIDAAIMINGVRTLQSFDIPNITASCTEVNFVCTCWTIQINPNPPNTQQAENCTTKNCP